MRRGRPILGLISGLLWGVGAAVLINLFGLTTLGPLLLYGAAGVAAVLSWAWSRRGRRHTPPLVLLALVVMVLMLLLPMTAAAQEAECEVGVDPPGMILGATTPSNPIVLDPADNNTITVIVWTSEFVEDEYASIWLDVGGVHVPLRSGSITGNEFIAEFSADNLVTPFGVLPGLHHVGGAIDGMCEVDGYVRVLGSPLPNPIGVTALALVVVGLAGTLFAGRLPAPPRHLPEETVEAEPPPPASRPETQPEEAPRKEAARAPSVPFDTRWLQARIFEGTDRIPLAYFRPDTSHDIEVRIGPEEAGWLAGTTPFPDDQLPGTGPHRLTVVLTEPNLLRTPQVSRIMLPGQGVSTSAWFELRTLADTARVDARLVVLHGNRVLHTARLPDRVGVAQPGAGERLTVGNVAEVETLVQVVGGQAQPFDAAFVVNHDSEGVAGVTEICGGEGRQLNLDEQQVANELHLVTEQLGAIVNQPADYEGINSPGATEMLTFLAQHGAMLRESLVHDFLDDLAANARLQVVSAKADSYFPFEFAYDFDPPQRTGATLCAEGVRLLSEGARGSTCSATHDASVVCPMGFWGLSKTIERHAYQPPKSGDPRFLVRSRPVEGRNRIRLGAGSMFAASNRVDDFAQGSIARVAAALATTSSGHSLRADTWQEWAADVKNRHPALLVLLSHTIYDETSGSYGAEIGDHDQLLTFQINKDYLPSESQPVIISLLGCETAVVGSISFETLPARFRLAGAEIVLGTITEMLGRHAAPIAERLITTLHAEAEAGPVTIGDVMVVLRRHLLAEGILAVLAVVAFGDAEWMIET
jgi:hypothetical protein